VATKLRSLSEILPALALTSVGAIGAGALLGFMAPHLEAEPGLLVMVPALIGFRGNISASMGARLSSAVHLGLLDPENPLEGPGKTNVIASLVLSVAIGAVVGLVGWASSVFFGLPTVGVWTFLFVAVATGLISGALLAIVTLVIVAEATRRGIDPDNVTGPLLTTVGDVITLGVLFGVVGVI
jgi:mgtE-like transporter